MYSFAYCEGTCMTEMKSNHDMKARGIRGRGLCSTSGIRRTAYISSLDAVSKSKALANPVMDSTERIEAASSFLLQSPPGEINDVLNGLS